VPGKSKNRPNVFMSHSSVNLEDAKQVEAALKEGGFDAATLSLTMHQCECLNHPARQLKFAFSNE